ncbi:MAG: hypothetical protein ACI9KE_001228 [Polyangiales bacterium]|jgi:hypothetical protein
MAYRSDQEAWVRRSEEAEARAQVAETRVHATEAALSELAAMKAKAPWTHAVVTLILLSLGGVAGWYSAPAEHRRGFFTALSTQALASRSSARYTWRAMPTQTTRLAARGEECTLIVDARDNDGAGERPLREIYVHLECQGRTLHRTSEIRSGGHSVGGCVLQTDGELNLFCSIGERSSRDGIRYYINTRSGELQLQKNGIQADFEITPHRREYERPERRITRGASTFESDATIIHVSGIPSEGTLPRPRVRVGAACQVLARSATGERESRCEVEIECAGTLFEASGVCSLDEVGQLERIVDLTVSQRDDERGDGNASLIFDVAERRLVLMEDNGHEAFLLHLSLESSRSRARFL